MPVFKPSSVYGRNVLRNVFEQASFSCQLVALPQALHYVDTTAWTWKNDWSKYVVTKPISFGGAETLYSGSDNSLAVNSITGAENQNAEIQLYSDENTSIVGAYYTIPADSPGLYAEVYNDLVNFGLGYTHCAIFVTDTLTEFPRKRPENANFAADPQLEINLDYFEARLISVVKQTEIIPSQGFVIPSQSYVQTYFNIAEFPPGALFTSQYNGPYLSTGIDFDDLITRLIESEGDLDTPAVTTPQTLLAFNQTYSYINVYSALQNQQFLTTAYTQMFVPITGTEVQIYRPHNCLIELLNVTTTAPADDSPASSWLEHRTNRYYVASTSGPYTYEPNEKIFTETFEYYGTTITVTNSYKGTVISPATPFEIFISPPASGSFSFTHLAVFATERTQPPAVGATYTYPNTDRFLGVIDMEETVTISSSEATARLIPLKVALMVGPLRQTTVTFS